ncbi:hypothetical protein GCM10009563_03950 [Subtercola frigoramans]
MLTPLKSAHGKEKCSPELVASNLTPTVGRTSFDLHREPIRILRLKKEPIQKHGLTDATETVKDDAPAGASSARSCNHEIEGVDFSLSANEIRWVQPRSG